MLYDNIVKTQKIFSIKYKQNRGKKHKVITILGIKIKLKQKPIKKKKILINGNCITEKIPLFLQTNKEFNEKFDIKTFKPVFMITEDDVSNYYKELSDCDIFLKKFSDRDELKEKNKNLKIKLLRKISNLQKENNDLRSKLQQNIFSLQTENNNLRNELQQSISSLKNENTELKKIPVYMASDDNYAPHLCATMYSMLEYTNSFVNFYILDGGLTLKSKNLIKESVSSFNNYSIEYIDMSKFNLNIFPNKRHYSLNTFSRYFIPKLKPDLEKVIYIDVDIIVKGDIAELYNIDLEGNALAAVPENFYCKNGEYVKEHVIPEFENTVNYFNAGVMLLDIRQFIENNYSNQLIDMTVKYYDRLSCPDQDIFNILFEHNHKLIDYKYNYMPDFYESYKKVTDNVDFLDNNAIVYHYTCGKPWKNNGVGVRKSDLYWDTIKKIAFYSEYNKKEGDNNG